ncbi:TPA: hypothetical protein UM343_000073 [Stenotrophomonas maltophilia]|uniref:Methyltransferase n=1 Tax=Stenotrophomonas riyadhensis TaxID=2859893 RepID=A0ABT2XCD5_9GAMM|nr:hypothetical protein [Stenotrophomonas sp. CFS3442]MBH1619530.1 hypothetical protein [Stenotrophomonas maltophilia]MCV0323604.1 hypothetical protein [Stenotrophomonas sp. CFS3442]HEL4109995.1 hypothetical protein [Stenotrophomonas maltophilia]HEL4242957.1 hypothetical protein [Stenotrophomonas maltophilia]
MKMNKIASNVLDFTRSTAGKVATGATAMIASGAALASGGPAEAITAEITNGKSSVSGILVVLAGVLGLFLLWSMIKRAK